MRITDIKVLRRRREDLGDLPGLAASIERYGLFHPIIIDNDNVLVAGERRLEAHRLLGRDEIDVRRWGDLTENERQEIELEENLQRKDLTEYERSRVLAQYVDVVRENAKTCADSAQVSKSARGPAKTPGSYRDIEERTNIPESTIRAAEQHVAAVEEFPDLADQPQSTAIKEAKQRRAKIDLPAQPKEDTSGQWLKELRRLRPLFSDVEAQGGITVIAQDWLEPQRSMVIEEIAYIAEQFTKWRSAL